MNLKRLLLFTPLLFALLLLREWQFAHAAVGLFNFQANSVASGISLSWQTGFEDNNLGFNLFRSEVNDRTTATLVNPDLIPSQSQGGGGASYDYLDSSVAPNILYFYWVETVGDALAEPVPPVSAAWTSGSGLVTNTPAPTSQPTQTSTPTPTPTITPTVDPSASATATSAATNTPASTATRAATIVPTATSSTSSSGQESPTATAPPAGSDTGSQPAPTAAFSGAGEEDSSPTEEVAAAPPGDNESSTAEPTNEVIAIQSTEISESAGEVAVQSSSTQSDAEAIGANTSESTGTTLTGSVVESDNNNNSLSTGILMLLIAGGVFLFGGGATAFILLRQAQSQEKSSQ